MANKPPTLNVPIEEQITPDGNPIQNVVPPKSERIVEQPKVEETPVVEEIPTPEETPVVDEKPKEELSDFTDFLKVKDEDVKIEKLPVKEEKVKPTEEAPIEAIPKKIVEQRDLSDLENEDHEIFKKMSNDAFNKVKPIYVEHKKLKAELEATKRQNEDLSKGIVKLPDNYYEHPNAFVLTPEFETTTQRVQLTNAIMSHWQQQLQKVKEGATEYDTIGQNPVTKQFEINGKAKAGPGAEVELLMYCNHAQQQFIREQAKLEALSTAHKQKSEDARNWLNTFSKQVFSIFHDPEKGKVYEPAVKAVVDSFPAAYRNSPLAADFARSLLVNNQLIGQVTELMKNAGQNPAAPKQVTIKTKDGKVIDPADKRKAGPIASDVGGASGNGNGEKEVSFDDFERAKGGY